MSEHLHYLPKCICDHLSTVIYIVKRDFDILLLASTPHWFRILLYSGANYSRWQTKFAVLLILHFLLKKKSYNGIKMVWVICVHVLQGFQARLYSACSLPYHSASHPVSESCCLAEFYNFSFLVIFGNILHAMTKGTTSKKTRWFSFLLHFGKYGPQTLCLGFNRKIKRKKKRFI